MSTRLPSRWPSAAALLAAGVLTSAAVAQSPDSSSAPPARAVPQAAPAAVLIPLRPSRFYDEPQLIEEEQVSEHADGPHAAPPVLPTPPRVYRGCGMPECDRDDGHMASGEMAFRCLLFTINPIAAFLPLYVEEEQQTLPSPAYPEPPPQHTPPTPDFPQSHREPERLEVMPVEVERLDVMPVEEESEPHYQLLAPWTDSARLFRLPSLPFPLTEVQVSVQESPTGAALFGVRAEMSRTGSITFTAEPLSEDAPAPMSKEETAGSARQAEVPQVMVKMLVVEVTGKGARKVNFGGPGHRWAIEVADEARQKALVAGLMALREKGQAKALAEPNLIALSGQQASFLSGGEQAVPVVTWLGQTGVRFEEFGTRVTCQPTVLPGGAIRLEVEPEMSELCEVTGATAQGVAVPGRSSQRVHTTADIPAGNALVLCGPKAGGNTRLVLVVTPTVIETAAAPGRIPQMIFNFSNAVRGSLEFFGVPPASEESSDPPPADGARGDAGSEESVHDLLVKCQRELARGHDAAAEDLAQRAIERDRKAVADDPLVRDTELLQRVKAIAALPLGTVEPCAVKGGGGIVPAGSAKEIGSDERMVEALLEAFNTAYKEARYRDAEALAERARAIDPANAMAVAALQLARVQMSPMTPRSGTAAAPQVSFRFSGDNTGAEGLSAAALVRFQTNFKEGRYEEAKAEALRALIVAPGNPVAAAAFAQACEALSRQPQPPTAPQCTYVGTQMRPALPAVDPAVVGALQKILIEGDKATPFGGSEEAEPKERR